jgi:hypothetical protein
MYRRENQKRERETEKRNEKNYRKFECKNSDMTAENWNSGT